MKKISLNSEKEIEFRVYSDGEYVDVYTFNRVIGELVWKALAEIAGTGDLQLLENMTGTNWQDRDSQFIGMNFWERYVAEANMKGNPLNDFIEPARLRSFQREISEMAGQDGQIVRLLPAVNRILHVKLSDRRGAKTDVLTLIVKYTRKRYLKMCHGFPSPERREYTHRLHQIFCVPPSEQRSFNRTLCRIIRQIVEGGTK